MTWRWCVHGWWGNQPRDASPSVGDQTCQFQYKLFDLECLGIEFEVVSDDNEDEYADDEASLLLASEDKVEIIIEQDRPWWVQLFEDLDLVMKLVMVPLWKRITKWP